MYRVPEVSLKKMTGYVVLVVENQNMDLIENGIKEVERFQDLIQYSLVVYYNQELKEFIKNG
jgi:nitrate reductase NapAB chaperone NapD